MYKVNCWVAGSLDERNNSQIVIKNYKKVVDSGNHLLLASEMFGILLDISFLMCYTFRRKTKKSNGGQTVALCEIRRPLEYIHIISQLSRFVNNFFITFYKRVVAILGVFVLLFCVFWRVYGFPLGTPFFVSNLKRKESKSNDTRRTNNSKPPPNDEY